MSRTNRALRVLPAILAVRCLGCDAFDSIVEWPPAAILAAPQPLLRPPVA